MDTNELTGKANEMRDELESQAEEMGTRAREVGENWRRRASSAMRNASVTADQYIHDNTWSSLTFAAVLGVVVGFLLGRSRD